MAETGRIQVFAKAPLPGLAKTRLIPALGAKGAAALQEQFIRRTLTTATATEMATELWCLPDPTHPYFVACREEFGVHLRCQQGTDLGGRMRRALDTGLADGGPVILVGTDCPDLTAQDMQEAHNALAGDCAVALGPAEDGGYYLIGLRRPLAALFHDMPWGTSAVLPQTRRRLREAGVRWHELSVRRDIDTPEDLAHLAATGNTACAAN